MNTNQQHLSGWLERKAFGLRVLFVSRLASLITLLALAVAAHADRMNNNNYFTMKKVGDHLHFSLQMADAYSNNTYCDWGGIIAKCNGQEVEVMILYSGDDDDDGPKWTIHAKDRNGEKWGGVSFITNTYPSGKAEQVAYRSDDFTPSHNIMKNDLYPKVEIDFYWPASMSGKNWTFTYGFNHVRNSGSDGGWKTMQLGTVYLGNSPVNFDYTTPNFKDYTFTRERMDKFKLTVPELPGDIPSILSSNRWFESDYELTMTYTMPSNTTQVIKNEILHGEVGKKKTFEIEIPNSVQKFTKMDLRIKATSRIKSVKGDHFWSHSYDNIYTDAFTSTPFPKNLVAEYRQYDNETELAWEAFSTGERYIENSVPYVYRIETNASGTPLSGQSWQKREELKTIGTQQTQSYTDQNVSSGKYYRYMVLNVPKDWINKGISTSDLNSPKDEVLERLPYTQSEVVSTAPNVTIFGLHQDTEVEDRVRLKWQYSRVPVNSQTVNFQVLRRTEVNGEWSPYGTITADSKPDAGAMVSFEDRNLPDNKTRYDYMIVLEMNNGAYRFESDPVTAGLLSGTMVKNLQATKGTHDAVVRVTWNAKQIGTANSTYVLSRRYAGSSGEFMQIYTAHGTAEQYVYEDNTVMPGYYYEYKVDVYGGDEGALQNVLTDIGFCQARGVISGLVNFGTGVAVKNVRMNLTTSGDDEAIRGYSKRIEGASTGLTWDAGAEAVNRLFGPDHDFTMQMYVRPDNGLADSAVVAQIPGVGKMYVDGTNENGYNLSIKSFLQFTQTGSTIDLSTLTGDYEAQNGQVLTGILRGKYKITIADGATVKLKDVTINGVNDTRYKWAGITCYGNATIILEGQNEISGFHQYYPGIYIAPNKTLNIMGQGELRVHTGYGAGIGGGYNISCGNINILGGYISSWTNSNGGAGIGAAYNGSCGDIYISGGTIYASSENKDFAGIGGGKLGTTGSITICSGVTYLMVYNSSGMCFGATANNCGPVTIGDNIYPNGVEGASYEYKGDGSGNTVTNENVKTGCTLPANVFSLLTLSRSGDKLSVQINQDKMKTFTFHNSADPVLFSIGGAEGITEKQAFRGNVTEVRVFDHALSESERTSYFDRTLNGRENGLCLYWPMDEGLDHYVFDASYANDVPNSRHATVGNNISTSTLLPTKQQLSRYGITNDNGEYIIRGIPFSGSGTSYRVVPELGIHDFSPSSRSMFISPSSITANNVNFEDVSSFPMEGYIYYAGTNVPAKGIQFYIDNELVTAQGEIKQTNDNGYYNISVPIGHHYVEARLEGHKLVKGGRFPTEGTFDFDRAVTYDFADSTLVNFVGRVGGGERNDTLAVGFGASKNNIGMATVVLRLNNDSYSFNCASDHISAAATERSWESDTTAIQSKAWTGKGDDSRSINIRTDSLTGEFSALLPPLKYIVKSVTIDNNKNIEFSVGQEVDLTNARAQRADTITVEDESGITNKLGYNYNAKRVFTYFASPQLDLRQKDNPIGAFGQRSVKYTTDEEGTTVSVDNLYSVDEKGNVSYRFGYPIYEMGASQHFMLHAFEEYINRDAAQPVSDIIPMNNTSLTISNEMSSEQSVVATVEDKNSGYQPGDIYELKNDKITLDSIGHAELAWTAGFPNIVSPHTRNFSVTMERKGRTYILGNLDAIVLGNITTGNNFITKGPDQVQFVLRDPPGAKSKTTLKVGQITTKTHYDTYTSYGDHSLVVNNLFGSMTDLGQGVGLMKISGHSVKDQLDTGTEAHWQYNHVKDTAVVTTTITSVSTGTSNPYVGSNGDVFVGTSYNFLIGTCRRLYLKQDQQTGEYAITLEDALALGDSIATTFNYSAYEIETVMIPKWKDQRARFITRVNSQAEAEAYVNNGSKDLYLSWVGEEDPNFGVNTKTKKTYHYLPSNNNESRIDSVLWCTNQIDHWVSVLYENEKEKVMAMRNKTATNFSIDGGSTRTFSERGEIVKWDEQKTTWRMGAVIGNQFGFHFKDVVSYGIVTKVQSNEGRGNTDGDGTKTQDYTEWEYTFTDGNRDTDISINQYNSDSNKNSKIFSIFGGQTYNPYEPQEFTKYYEPGTPLGNGTVQMEQPNLMIGIGSEPPAKSVTITDIPAGSEANLTIYCTNMANAHQGTNFSYNLAITERTNDKGLEILMDGVPVNGRSVFLDQGETTTKVLTIRQTDQGILDYEGIQLRFCSQYQPAKISDVVTINAHFKPSSSPVNLVIQEPVLNTMSQEGKLQLKLTGFNRQFKNLKNVGVQYRFAGNTEWIDLHTWVTDKADSTSTSFSTLPSEGDLRWAEDMSSNLSYPEGNYEFRAFTTTPYDTEPIRVYSDIVTVTKDMTRPRNLYTPSPAHGILGYGDQLAIEFNEDIVPGYVGDKNVIVTAKLNSQQVNHEVALHLNPFGEQPRTQNPVFLKGDFSIDFWLNWHDAGTLMHLGANISNFALNIREDGYVVAKIAGNEFVSSQPMPKDNWTFVALAYKANSMTFDMLALSEDKSINLFQNKPVAQQAVQAVGYTNDNYLYLGGLNAEIHALSLYDIYRDVHDAGATKNQSKDNYVYGLANYWPMDEGHGRTAADSRRTHDFDVPQSWTLENVNYALRIDNTDGVAADISRINTRPGDSYAVELWFDCSIPTPDGQVIFETATPGAEQDLQKQSAKLRLRRDGQDNLILDYGTKSQVLVNLINVANNETWNHLIFNVVRGQAASFYLNGQRTAVIAEADVPPLTGSRLLVGKGSDLKFIDELRIWHASLSEQRLLQNIYNAIDTSEVYSRGLVAYYPFEQTGVVNGVTTKVPTLKNMMGDDELQAAQYALIKNAPPIKNAPEEVRLIASPVASERKVVVNLTGAGISPRDIEGTMLNVTVDQVRDLHGNTSLPIRWSAYVQQNTLLWAKDSVNIIKQYGKGYTFDVNIENWSGNTEYYTLYNMPEWLTLVDSYTQDELAPIKTKTLRFEVNPQVAVGNYDVTIGLQGNLEILEPLRIVMKVRAEKPQWTVDPTKYEHQMNYIGQVYINGILMENAESMVAAFIDGECRGIASPEQVRGAAYVTMNVYGNSDAQSGNDTGKPINFRIWDASAGIAYTDVHINAYDGSATKTAFAVNEIVGSFDQPVIWAKGTDVEQLLKVNQNWNWISLGVDPADKQPHAVFPELTKWNTIIKGKSIEPVYSNGTEWAPSGALIQSATAYKIRITPTTEDQQLPEQLSVSGAQLDLSKTPVVLTPGWNWIAYMPLSTMTIGQALAAAHPEVGDYVKSQHAIAFYSVNGWEGSLKALESGHAYMYNSTANTEKSFVYPTASASGRAAVMRRIAEKPFLFTPIGAGNYPDNMSMVIRLLGVDKTVIDTCEVAAFIDDECRGTTRANGELYYLVIAGEGSGQPLELRTCINGKMVTIDHKLTFTTDQNIGTPWSPYVIDLSEVLTGIIDISSDEEDDEDWWSVQGFKIGHKPIQPGVYIHHGKKVTIK